MFVCYVCNVPEPTNPRLREAEILRILVGRLAGFFA